MNNNDNDSSSYLSAGISIVPVLEDAVTDFLVGVMGCGVEQSVDHSGSELLHLNIYFEEKFPDQETRRAMQNKMQSALDELSEIFAVQKAHISWEMIAEQDWSSSWKVHFKPFAIIPGLIIAPTWEPYLPAEGELLITMDPGMAFGTGHHATTSTALQMLRGIIENNNISSMLDVGCGTGILGMGAALFGCPQVLAIDNDPEAVKAAVDNVALNRLQKAVTVAATPLDSVTGQVDCVAANIIHDVLLVMHDDFKRLLSRGGHLVLSGLLQGAQESNIKKVFARDGFTFKEELYREEWVSLHFVKD